MLLTTLLPLCLPFLTLLTRAQQSPLQIDCPSTSNTTDPLGAYVNAILTVLTANNYHKAAETLALLSETEEGYEVLEGMYETSVGSGNRQFVILAPQDSAFTASSITPSTLSPLALYDLLTPHLLSPSTPISTLSALLPSTGHATVPSLLPSTAAPAFTASGFDETKTERAVLALEGGEVKVVLVTGNATVQGGSGGGLDMGNATALVGGLRIYGLDSILSPSESLYETLSLLSSTTLPTSLSLYLSALNLTSLLPLLSSPNLTTLTIFAPANAAFNGDMRSPSTAAWESVLKGMYTTEATIWGEGLTQGRVVKMANGVGVTVGRNGTTTTVTSPGGGTGRVVRSDIGLEGGGVLHIIDTVLSASQLIVTSSTAVDVSAGFRSTSLPSAAIILSLAAAMVFGIAL